MYHHCHHQRVLKCLKKSEADQKLSDLFVLTRNTHSLQTEAQNVCRNRLNAFQKYKRVRAPTNNRNLNRIRISNANKRFYKSGNNTKLFSHGSRSVTFKSFEMASKRFAGQYNKRKFNFTFLQKYKMSYVTSPMYLDYVKTTIVASTIAAMNEQFSRIFVIFGIINKLLCEKPFAAGLTIITLQAMAASIFTQMHFESKKWNEIDCARLLHFGIYYFLVCGCINYYLVNKFYWKLFPSMKGKHIHQTLKRVSLEQLVVTPFFIFPSFYIVKEYCHTLNVPNNANYFADEDTSHGGFYQRLKAAGCRAMKGYGKTFWQDNGACLSIWVPTQLITYGVLPKHLRFPWMSLVAFGWMCILSHYRCGCANKVNVDSKMVDERLELSESDEQVTALFEEKGKENEKESKRYSSYDRVPSL